MMKDATPYRERPPTQIAAELNCMAAIFARAQPVAFIFEAFGGLGGTAKIMAKRFPNAQIASADLDAECVNIYNRELRGTYAICAQADARQMLCKIKSFPRHWGASLDFNKFTLMDVMGRKEGQWKVDLIEAVIERQPIWIQLTDSAVRYLHLNHKRCYDCKPDPYDYIQTLSRALNERWGLEYVTHSSYYAASYLLLTPIRL